MNIDNIFSEDGIFAQKLEGYAPRPGQIKMAKAWYETLQRALKEPEKGPYTLLAEGPTGVGKSFAYSTAPIVIAEQIRRKKEEDEKYKVVIATANIALQTQLFEKDLPFLVDTFEYPITYGLLKG